MNMKLFFWIIDMLIPAMMLVMGTLLAACPPKKINILYGYRTTLSMASQEAWDYANPLCGKIWLITGAALAALVAADKLALPFKPEYISLFHAVIGMTLLILPIPFIEKKLKTKFK